MKTRGEEEEREKKRVQIAVVWRYKQDLKGSTRRARRVQRSPDA